MTEQEQAQISVLGYPDNVRLRRGMYLKNPDHCIFEIVDNAVDEFSAGRCNEITVMIIDDTVIVIDNGSGIPITLSTDAGYEGMPQAEVAYTVLHAGGKFGLDGGYKTNTGGMNGVGASCVNATSKVLNLIIHIDGKEYEIDFAKGITTNKLYETREEIEAGAHGTEVRFKLDEEVWHDEWYDFSHIKTRLKQLAYLNKGLTINFVVDSHDAEGNAVNMEEVFNFPDGLIGYLNDVNGNKTQLITPELISKSVKFGAKDICNDAGEHIKTVDLTVDIEIGFSYSESFSGSLKSFVNNVATEYGGDHEVGFSNGLHSAIRKFALENKLVKDAKQITSDDCKEGLQTIVSVKLPDPNFEGQGKGRLRMGEIRTAVRTVVEDFFYDYLCKDKNKAEIIMDKALKAAKAREAAKRARDAARGVKKLANAHAFGLADCSSNDPELCSIYIVEGDSAGGSAKQGRDRRFQAIYPFFGKGMNVEKTPFAQVVKSPKIKDLVCALGCGIGEEFDIDKTRYHRVVLMSDADIDGAHICALHLTFFYRYMRPLIEAGYVYIACPPLYKVYKKKGKGEEIHYLYSDDELAAFDTTGYNVQRYKGLGEMSPEQLWETTMDPENARLIQIKVETAEEIAELTENGELCESEKAIRLCMGEKVEPRRLFIMNRLAG